MGISEVDGWIACGRCHVLGRRPDNFGSDRECAFATGIFHSKNWNCGTMNELRDVAEGEGTEEYYNDQHAIVLPGFPGPSGPANFIVLGWYKSRGRTEFGGVLAEYAMQPLTLDVAERYLALRDLER